MIRKSNDGERAVMTDREAKYKQASKLMELGAFSESASQFYTLIADASDARFQSAYGIFLQKLGRWTESIQQFEAALALKHAYCEADWRNMLALSYLLYGQEGRAIAQWRIVVDMEPSYPSRDVPIDESK